ncbi:MAG: hypothetical protein M3Q89_02080 [Verrucomicrobiota bacterium]|nr:hypothetical protein [Verrucomicrobiota bacterium]
MLNLILSGYVAKVLYQVLATPLYLVVNKLKRAKRVEVVASQISTPSPAPPPLGRRRRVLV